MEKEGAPGKTAVKNSVSVYMHSTSMTGTKVCRLFKTN